VRTVHVDFFANDGSIFMPVNRALDEIDLLFVEIQRPSGLFGDTSPLLHSLRRFVIMGR